MKVTIEGDNVQDVVDLMNGMPGGEYPFEPCCGFHEDRGDPADEWEFYVGDAVGIVATGESGFVESVTRDLYKPDSFKVQFTSRHDASTVRKWFAAEDLVDIPLN